MFSILPKVSTVSRSWIALLLLGIALAVPATLVRADEPKQEQKPDVKAETKAETKADTKTMKFVRQDVGAYVLEVPEGWKIGEETPWGARDIMPASAFESPKAADKSAGKPDTEASAKQETTATAPASSLQNYITRLSATAKLTSMSAMTAPGAHNEPWEKLYQTSLFFIMQTYKPGEVKAMPFKVAKAKQGYEACSWTMEEKDGGVRARHVVLRNSAGKILALSIKFPTTKGNEVQDGAFEHMVSTASLK